MMSQRKMIVARARLTTAHGQRLESQKPNAKLQKMRAKVLGRGLLI